MIKEKCAYQTCSEKGTKKSPSFSSDFGPPLGSLSYQLPLCDAHYHDLIDSIINPPWGRVSIGDSKVEQERIKEK